MRSVTVDSEVPRCSPTSCPSGVLDELGYLALPDGAAELVFQVLSDRYERGALLSAKLV